MSIPPTTIGPMACRRNSNDVTTPKLLLPPRSPQNRSSFSSSLAVRNRPSAVTTSADIRLSQASPYFGESQPYPPPSVNPPIPVVVTRPPGDASPNACVSRSYSPQRTPPFARAVLPGGSTRTPFMRDRSINRPSSQVPLPATLCPPHRTATGSEFSRAKSTAAMTSATPRGRMMSAGLLSIMAFQTRRAVSYGGSFGTTSSPLKSSASLPAGSSSSVVFTPLTFFRTRKSG